MKRSTAGSPEQDDRLLAQCLDVDSNLFSNTILLHTAANDMPRPRVHCPCESCRPQQRLVSHSLPRQHLQTLALHPEAVSSPALRRIAHERQVRLLANSGAAAGIDGSDSGSPTSSNCGISASAADDDGDDTASETSAAGCRMLAVLRRACVRPLAAPPRKGLSRRRRPSPTGPQAPCLKTAGTYSPQLR